MKKLLLLLMVAFVSAALFACGEKEFAVDGEFLAYEVSVHRNGPQVTYVTVTIEKGEIVAYSIDARQGPRTGGVDIVDEDDVVTGKTPYVWAWNAQTKKELGAAYNMKRVSEIDKEWDEQAAAIEAFWLENGVEAVTVNADGYIDNVAGASIRDPYSAIALKALDNARAGKFVAILATGTDLYSAEMTLTSKGAIDTLILDVQQSTRTQADGTFVWRDQTKQELGAAYGMIGAGGYVFTDGAWVSQGNTTLEWNEQVALITDYIIANGWSTNLQPVQVRGGSLNGTDLLPELAGATIRTGGYYTVLKSLFDFAGSAVK